MPFHALKPAFSVCVVPHPHPSQDLEAQVMMRLCRGLDLGERLALLEAALLLEAENLEAVEVGQVLPPLDLSAALEPAGLLPLLVDLGSLPGLLQGAVAGAAGELGDSQGREKGGGERKRLAGNSELGV